MIGGMDSGASAGEGGALFAAKRAEKAETAMRGARVGCASCVEAWRACDEHRATHHFEGVLELIHQRLVDCTRRTVSAPQTTNNTTTRQATQVRSARTRARRFSCCARGKTNKRRGEGRPLTLAGKGQSHAFQCGIVRHSRGADL